MYVTETSTPAIVGGKQCRACGASIGEGDAAIRDLYDGSLCNYKCSVALAEKERAIQLAEKERAIQLAEDERAIQARVAAVFREE